MKYVFFKNSFLILSLILGTSCSDIHVNSANQPIKTDNVLIKQLDNIYNYYYDGNKAKEKNNLKLVFENDKIFNTKYMLRKTSEDISKLDISFCDSFNNCQNFTINFDGKSGLKDLSVNIKNVPPGTYYARAVAKDSSENILNKNLLGYDQSNNITVDPDYYISSSQFLKINIDLKDSVKSNIEEILASEPQVNYSNVSTDEKGDGIVYWIINSNTIKIKQLKEYIPVGTINSFDVGSDSINSLTASWSGNQGIIIYSKNSGGSSYLAMRKMNINSSNAINVMSEIPIESESGLNKYKDLYINLDNRGTGSLVLVKYDSFLKDNIYVLKLDEYNHSPLVPFFTDNKTNKSKPVISIDNNGKGVIIWQDDLTTKEIMLSRVANYVNYDNGIIFASGPSVTGTGSTFTTDIPSYQQIIRVEDIVNPLLINTVTDDTNLILQSPESFTNRKYAVVISENGFSDDISPNVVTNNSGMGLIVWKSDELSGLIKSLKLNNFNLLGSLMANGPSDIGITQDSKPVGLSLNSEGYGMISFTSGSVPRNLNIGTISDFLLSTSFSNVVSHENLLGADLSLSNGGSGILIYSFGSSYENMAFRHIKEYTP